MDRTLTGQTVTLTDGSKINVGKLLGEGGQGCVYEVEHKGEKLALKWYKRQPSRAFYENICKNAQDGAPSQHFVWPMAVTRIEHDSFGYLMPLRPDNYHDFADFRLAKCRFHSFMAITVAAMEICDAFRLLHAQGLSYQDLNDGNFFIDPATGHVLICDNDNVFPHGQESGILGKARYMAPEVVSGKKRPDTYSDRFSLSVILYMLFCLDHPFEGNNVVRYPCMTEEIECRLFGTELLFMHDPNNDSNRPVPGVHNNDLVMWPLLPQILRETFMDEFGQDKLHNPEQRRTELEWLNVLTRTRDCLTRCPHCGDETFVTLSADGNASCIAPRCHRTFHVDHCVHLGTNRRLPLLPGVQLYFERDTLPEARVVRKPDDASLLLMQNVSPMPWAVYTPSGKVIAVEPRGFVPIKAGLSITRQTGVERLFIKSSTDNN